MLDPGMLSPENSRILYRPVYLQLAQSLGVLRCVPALTLAPQKSSFEECQPEYLRLDQCRLLVIWHNILSVHEMYRH